MLLNACSTSSSVYSRQASGHQKTTEKTHLKKNQVQRAQRSEYSAQQNFDRAFYEFAHGAYDRRRYERPQPRLATFLSFLLGTALYWEKLKSSSANLNQRR